MKLPVLTDGVSLHAPAVLYAESRTQIASTFLLTFIPDLTVRAFCGAG
ncbi:MAG: hypothetical protein ABL890_02890 [Candidatus Peribacteraceae bacterium]